MPVNEFCNLYGTFENSHSLKFEMQIKLLLSDANREDGHSQRIIRL